MDNQLTHICRCGHDRDDHQARTWQEDGLKYYGEICEKCHCRSYLDSSGPLSQLIDSTPVMPMGEAQSYDEISKLRVALARQSREIFTLRAEIERLNGRVAMPGENSEQPPKGSANG